MHLHPWTRGFGQIDGVAKRGDQPAGGVMVLLVPDENLILFRRDQSDSDGTFTLGNIVPGRYRLLAALCANWISSGSPC
jgi:hypothetical protein